MRFGGLNGQWWLAREAKWKWSSSPGKTGAASHTTCAAIASIWVVDALAIRAAGQGRTNTGEAGDGSGLTREAGSLAWGKRSRGSRSWTSWSAARGARCSGWPQRCSDRCVGHCEMAGRREVVERKVVWEREETEGFLGGGSPIFIHVQGEVVIAQSNSGNSALGKTIERGQRASDFPRISVAVIKLGGSDSALGQEACESNHGSERAERPKLTKWDHSTAITICLRGCIYRKLIAMRTHCTSDCDEESSGIVCEEDSELRDCEEDSSQIDEEKDPQQRVAIGASSNNIRVLRKPQEAEHKGSHSANRPSHYFFYDYSIG